MNSTLDLQSSELLFAIERAEQIEKINVQAISYFHQEIDTWIRSRVLYMRYVGIINADFFGKASSGVAASLAKISDVRGKLDDVASITFHLVGLCGNSWAVLSNSIPLIFNINRHKKAKVTRAGRGQSSSYFFAFIF